MPLFQISQSPAFRQRVPNFVGIALQCEVQNAPSSEALWSEIAVHSQSLSAIFTPDNIKLHPAISATRLAYKACGKDPSRYRPASEQLLRRVVQGKSLYRVNELVDLGNWVSMRSGYPTGLLDSSKIVPLDGKKIILDIGTAHDHYEGIGRGLLNVEGLPLYRDAQGGIASPTSDSVRTMLSLESTQLLFLINGYGGDVAQVHETAHCAIALLERFAHARNISLQQF